MTTNQRACIELQSLNANIRDCIKSHINTGIAFHSQLRRLMNRYDEITVDLISAHAFGLKKEDFGLPITPDDRNTTLADTQRKHVLRETLSELENASPDFMFHRIGSENLQYWQRHIQPISHTGEHNCKIYVENADWGIVALQKTEEFGTTFAVLNTADKSRPGAYYETGSAGQEADMYRRTDCHFSLSSAVIDMEDDRKCALYLPEHVDLITAKNGEVYIDIDHPRVCLRGPANGTHTNSSETYPIDNKWLPEKDIFLFYELRAAPYELSDYLTPVSVENVIRKHICAILQTLIYKGIKHAVLGAFGCSKYPKYTASVAKIFNEELDKCPGDFDVVTFAVPNHEHFEIFTEEFTRP